MIEDPNGISFIAQNDNNNGFVKFVKKEKYKQFPSNTLIIGRQTGVVYYQENEFITTDGVLVLIPKYNFIKNKNIGLGLSSVLSKKMLEYCYSNTVSATKLKKIKIKLPMTNNKIDLKFIDLFIGKIRKENKRILINYLAINNLLNSDIIENKEILNDYNNIEFKDYKLEDIFNSSNGDFDIKKEHLNDKGYLVVSSGITNTGIIGKTDVNAKVFKPNTITIDMFGDAFYRNYEYKIVTHGRVFALTPRMPISNNIGLFFESSLKYISHLFSYSNMCSWNKIKQFTIKLPTKDNDIDFDFIECFIEKIKINNSKKIIEDCLNNI